MKKDTYIADCGTCGTPIHDYPSNRKKTSTGRFYCSPACRVKGTIKPATVKVESRCVSCRLVKIASDFYQDKHSKSNGGLSYSCKQCTLEKRKLYYDANSDAIIKRNAYYAKAHPENHRKHGRNQRAKQTKQEWAAWRALNTAVRRGEIVKPPRCTNCERQAKLHAHHHRGYGIKYRLDVVWLCVSCHHSAHGRGPKTRSNK
jgi:hypothetical protein